MMKAITGKEAQRAEHQEACQHYRAPAHIPLRLVKNCARSAFWPRTSKRGKLGEEANIFHGRSPAPAYFRIRSPFVGSYNQSVFIKKNGPDRAIFFNMLISRFGQTIKAQVIELKLNFLQ